MDKNMDLESTITLKTLFMMDIGSEIKNKGMEHSNPLKDSTLGNGKAI